MVGFNNEGILEDTVCKQEQYFFTGREKEILIYCKFIENLDNYCNILMIHGEEGVGKSFLLRRFRQIAKEKNIIFCYLDCRDFFQTPLSFAELLYSTLEIQIEKPEENIRLSNCIKMIRNLAEKRQIIIGIDSYEYFAELDHWLREVFIEKLPVNVQVIISGQQPLSGEWVESPAWHSLIKQIHLKPFSRKETKNYLSRHPLYNKSGLDQLWSLTHGNPRALAKTVLEAESWKGSAWRPERPASLLPKLTKREEEIVKLILDGHSNKEIAEDLFIAEITVKKHISRILKKVGVKNRVQLIKRLIEV